MDISHSEHTTDLSALAWVQEELRKSLDNAHKALRRCLKEAENAASSDVDDVDPAILRGARLQIHQGVGALEILSLQAGAALLRASENAVQRYVARPQKLDLATVETIEKASFAVLDYIARLLAGKSVSPVALFPQYEALQKVVGAERVHPADLWPVDWQWRDVPVQAPAAPRAADAGALGAFEEQLLGWMRQSPAAGRALADLCGSMAAASMGASATLWKLSAAFFEGLAAGRITPDVHAKRAASRLLAQLRNQVRSLDGVDHQASERLAQDLLFFCAQAGDDVKSGGGDQSYLSAVRLAYRLVGQKHVDYTAQSLGRFDPAWVALARKRVTAAKEAWSSVAGGELVRLPSLGEQFSLVGDSLNKLYTSGDALAQALQHVVAQTVQSGAEPVAPVAMEVATSVLYLEASLEDGDFDEPGQAERVQRLAQRLSSVAAGQPPEPLEAWMEELYRRVSDKQTIGSVVQELRTTLSEAEKNIDQFFRNTEDRSVLVPVPAQLQSMRGVLSVLDLSHAAHAVMRMRDDIDLLILPSTDVQQAGRDGVFDRLASNLGALGFLVDMLGVQPQLAKSLFSFDSNTGILHSLMGQRAQPPVPVPQAQVAPEAPRLIEQAQSVAQAATSNEIPLADVSLSLDQLSQDSFVQDQPALAASIASAQGALEQAEQAGAGAATESAAREQVAQAMADFVHSVSEPMGLDPLPHVSEASAEAFDAATSTAGPLSAPAPLVPVPAATAAAAAAAVDTGLEEDDEMRGIFLEEAREVIGMARDAVAQLKDMPGDMEQLTVVRRGFHTLKGSSRMVGLKDYGEAGWACEQLFNSWLATQQAASADLLNFTTSALDSFEAWVNEIEARRDDGHRRDPLIRSADALRLEGRLLSLDSAAAPGGGQAEEGTARGEPLAAGAVEPLPAVAEASAFTDVPALEEAVPAAAVPELIEAAPVELDLPDAGSEGLEAPEAIDASADFPIQTEIAAEEPLLSDAQVSVALQEPSAFSEEAAGVSSVVNDFVETTPSAHLGMPEELEKISLDLSSLDEEHAAAPASANEITFELPDAEASPAATEPAAEAATEAVADDDADSDQVKVIGHLRIGIPLFNVYLNEADEQSRALCMELAEWAMTRDAPVSDRVVALAHSLAGNSATVGFADLSQIARALEHALSRSQMLGLASADEAVLFNETADEIRRLLHQFAAGFLKTASPQLVERLADLDRVSALRMEERSLTQGYGDVEEEAVLEELAPAPAVIDEPIVLDAVPSVLGGETDLLGDGMPAMPAAVADEVPAFTESEAPAVVVTEAHQSQPVEAPVSVPAELGLPEFRPFAELPKQELAAAAHVAPRSVTDLDDDIDVEDIVDPDLFPIFEEEALELLPELHGQMREWIQRPADPAAASACMRTLHTFKGGARLAGAMRVGEMAHRMETAVEKLLSRGNISAADVEDIQVHSDALGEAFETLRARDASSYEEANRAAETAPVAEPAPASVSPTPVALAAAVAADVVPAEDAAPAAAVVPATPRVGAAVPQVQDPIDWTRFAGTHSAHIDAAVGRKAAGVSQGAVRVQSKLLDRLVNQAGEVSISRSRLASEVGTIKSSLGDLTDNLDRLRGQLRDIELHSETQMASRMEAARAASQSFDPLEFDRFTRFQEITRMMAESVNDVATVQRALQRTLDTAEDQLVAQARLTRDLQDDLLRTRMVEFEGLSERLYRVVRQAAKETGKQVRLDIVGGATEVDRGVLDRMTPSFEHLLRNCVTHGIEAPEARQAAGKEAIGSIVVALRQEGNEVSVEFRDDGAGLNLKRILEKGRALGMVGPDEQPPESDLAQLIFQPGFSTAETVTELAGRGVGMDVVRSEINAMGGRIETSTSAGQGTSFKLVLPLTTAVTQVVMLRAGDTVVAVPTHLIEIVRRAKPAEVEQSYANGTYIFGDFALPFFWLGALLQSSSHGSTAGRRSLPVIVVRSASQRVALHVDEVLGNQEVIVKNLGPQLSRLPGLAGMTLLASGAVALIYNPVALATVYGESARAMTVAALQGARQSTEGMSAEQIEAAGADAGKPVQADATPVVPLVLVVDDSLTVRRVTQRLLAREGYRVTLAKDGLDALERLAEERPSVVLSDIEMPRMDGFDLVRNIRADAKLADLPVIMITSRIAQKHRDYAQELGVNHYLGKPYSEEELLGLIASYTAMAATQEAGSN